MTELEDHVVDLNQRIAQLMNDNEKLERRVGQLSASPQHPASPPRSPSGVSVSHCARLGFVSGEDQICVDKLPRNTDSSNLHSWAL